MQRHRNTHMSRMSEVGASLFSSIKIFSYLGTVQVLRHSFYTHFRPVVSTALRIIMLYFRPVGICALRVTKAVPYVLPMADIGKGGRELVNNDYLRCDTAQPLPGAAAAVELGHDHGVADRHQQDRDEEHDDVHKEVVDLLGDLDVDHVVGLQVALQPGGEDLVAGPLVPDHAPGLVLNTSKHYL